MSIILGIIGEKKKEVPERIIRKFWSIIDLSLSIIEMTHLHGQHVTIQFITSAQDQVLKLDLLAI